MPLSAENENAAHFFLPEFIQRFLLDRATIAPLLDHRWFSRLRRLNLEITLALIINRVRPGERVGYQKVIDRFFSETGLAFGNPKGVKPPTKRRFIGPARKFPSPFSNCFLPKPLNMLKLWPVRMNT